MDPLELEESHVVQVLSEEMPSANIYEQYVGKFVRLTLMLHIILQRYSEKRREGKCVIYM